jgi:phosphoesterase RecJ-like protein
MNKQTEQVYSYINSEGKILVVSHFSPDGDAIGSLLAFGGILEQFGKEHDLAIDDHCPEKYNFMPGFDKIRNLKSDPITAVYDKVVILDAGSMTRIGSAKLGIDEHTTIMNIDHHFTGDLYGKLNIVDPDACATAVILYDLCLNLEIEISPQIAYGIYVGILTDTGRFRYSNTTSKALCICSEMIAKGVAPGMVVDKLYFNISTKVVSSIAWGLSKMEIHCNGLVSIIHLDQKHYVPDVESLVDFGLSVKGVVLSAFISEMDKNQFKVSLRSRCDVDVSAVAKLFGGGGHQKASGFRISGIYADAKPKIIDELQFAINQINNVQSDLERVENVKNYAYQVDKDINH